MFSNLRRQRQHVTNVTTEFVYWYYDCFVGDRSSRTINAQAEKKISSIHL